MSDGQNQHYLQNKQYKDAGNLSARAALHERFTTNTYGWHQWVFDNLQAIPPNATVLELGCGPGWLWTSNAERIPAGWTITLSDFSPGMVEQAQANHAAIERSFTYKQIDAQTIPFDDDQSDAILANHMLYHVPDLPKALAEIRRVLKPGGIFLAATNSLDHMSELRAMVKDFGHGLGVTLNNQMMESFSLDAGGQALEAVFASVETRRYADALHVTEVAPLVDYVFSMVKLEEPARSAAYIDFTAYVSEKMAANNGIIVINKGSGVFIAK